MKLVIAAILVATTAARADTSQQLAFGSSIRSLHSDSANALTGDSLVGGEVAYAYHLPFELPPNFALWGELAFVGSSASGTMFGNLSTEIALRQTTLGAQLRYAVMPHVTAFARGAIGPARDALRVTDAAGHTASDARWGAVATGAIGIDLLAVDSQRFDIGLRLELGYTLASAVALSPAADHASDDTIRLDMQAASIGHLDLGGMSFGAGLVSRF